MTELNDIKKELNKLNFNQFRQKILTLRMKENVALWRREYSQKFSKKSPKPIELKNQTIELNKIIGTSHDDHTGPTWEDITFSLRKLETNYNKLQQDPQYYFDNSNKNDINLYTTDNKTYYTGNDGTTRIFIAKVLSRMYPEYKQIQNVSVKYYQE